VASTLSTTCFTRLRDPVLLECARVYGCATRSAMFDAGCQPSEAPTWTERYPNFRRAVPASCCARTRNFDCASHDKPIATRAFEERDLGLSVTPHLLDLTVRLARGKRAPSLQVVYKFRAIQSATEAASIAASRPAVSSALSRVNAREGCATLTLAAAALHRSECSDCFVRDARLDRNELRRSLSGKCALDRTTSESSQ
jgi:hypothetical protein